MLWLEFQLFNQFFGLIHHAVIAVLARILRGSLIRIHLPAELVLPARGWSASARDIHLVNRW